METSEILKKVRQIEIKTRGLSNNIFAGQYLSLIHISVSLGVDQFNHAAGERQQRRGEHGAAGLAQLVEGRFGFELVDLRGLVDIR